MSGYKTDIDYEYIAGCSQDQLFDYIQNNFVSTNYLSKDGYSFKRRAKFMGALCMFLKLKPNPEQWIFILSDCERLLCEACAGAGKTTMAQLKLIDAKVTDKVAGKNVLALAYNNHAVKDMRNKHEGIITRLNNMKIPGLKADRDICCHTFHSFCLSWIMDYAEKFGINPKSFLLGERDITELMKFAADTYKRKFPDSNIYISDMIISSLISLYTFGRETLTGNDVESYKLCSAMSDLKELPISAITHIFGFYDRAKSLKKRMDFADTVDAMYSLMIDPEICKRIRTNYSVVMVDEYQDITPAMLRVINAMMEGCAETGIGKYQEGKLICIGDGDQSIYGFRGTDPDNCIRFRDSYSSENSLVKITSMSENRRCPNKIIDVARKIIESNDRRIMKPILSIRDGGSISVVKYTTEQHEMQVLVNNLKMIPVEDLRKTCICYRNLSSSFMATLRLVESGIPFRFGRGNMPLTDKLSTAMFGILNMLSYPDNLDYMRANLFKVLPKSSKFTKVALDALINQEAENRKAGKDINRFWSLDFAPEVLNISGFSKALQVLASAYQLHRKNQPMSSYVPDLVKLVRIYYLDWQLQKGTQLSAEYLEYVITWFTRNKSYDNFMLEYVKLKETIEGESNNGVYMTTLHGLKGLEFDNVHIIDLNDQVFPGTELKAVATLSDEQKSVIENESRRLFYVAVTRTRDKLTLYFDDECPTRYLRFFQENKGIANAYEEYLNKEFTASEGFLVADSINVDHSNRFSGSIVKTDIMSADLESTGENTTYETSSNTGNQLDVDVGLDFDIDIDIEDPTLDIDMNSTEALLERTAGKNNLEEGFSIGFELPLDDTRLAPEETLTIEQAIELEDIRDAKLEKTLPDGMYDAVANKPKTKNILAMILEKEY